MKLYATTTSERATKGQGGNKYLNIVITCGDDRQILANIEVKRQEANVIFYSVYCNDEKIAERIEVPKGNKQKTAKTNYYGIGRDGAFRLKLPPENW